MTEIEENKKIKFKKYTVSHKGNRYDVLIPLDMGRLWMEGYDYKYNGERWVGDRKGLGALLYGAAVLGYHPQDKLVYFPLRENWKRGYSVPDKYEDGKEECDIVFTTHQTPFKRSSWKEIKRQFRYLKAETYILDFDGKRTEDYFDRSTDQWVSSFSQMKECPLRDVREHTCFYVLSRKMFQGIFLSVYDFLRKDLERESLEKSWMMGNPVWIGGKCFPYRERMQIDESIWIFFYDTEIEKQVEKWLEERNRTEQISTLV